MEARTLDGLATSKDIRQEVADRAEKLISEKGITPRLSVILVGGDPASVTYTRMKKKACEKAGMISDLIELPSDSTQESVKDIIKGLNDDPTVHGIMVQHPVPSHLDEMDILSTVAVEKDVDGISAMSLGRLVLGTADFVSCTPLGIIMLMERYGLPFKGKEAVVVGRSIILGKPVALALLERHATVTICHSRTQDLPGVVRRADILVAAIGKPEFIKGDWVKEGAVVIDAGYNRVEGLDHDVGDVEFEEAKKRAGWITPVPGGVGPMTIAMLLSQTVKSAEKVAGGG
ncbi:MAG: bifunctional methylenetetrahydrofolate dehydrogenase/methenyltetrahydrofolate cyclohydrolase [Armatimonadetes bacterium RBG_16_58_9]|nr:MAG: bifunctional methylenetetrahydrofolate dehydrogenase/methenyltetrahydrofolate cyclohydrolase [Armatimonadetes bacterium RBG_16_58_9]